VIGPLRRRVVLFAGGGTGGHTYPALAVARAMPPGVEPVFLVPPDRGDAGRIGGEFRVVEAAAPRIDPGRVLYPARLARAVARARRVLRETQATGVVALGGYTCVPAAVAARLAGVPLYVVECNAVPGRATRLLSRFASGVGLGAAPARELLPRRARQSRALVTGTPLRAEAASTARPADFGLEEGRPTLLVLGGSQGAAGLNERVLAGLPRCRDLPFQVLHCAGAGDAARVRAGYAAAGVRAAVLDFLPDIGRAYAAADLVLARGGASTVAECAASGRPAVFVPYPWHRDRQQARNAEESVRAGAAQVVEEADLSPDALRGLVDGILLDAERRGRMARAARSLARPAAAAAMAAHILECLAPSRGERGTVVELVG